MVGRLGACPSCVFLGACTEMQSLSFLRGQFHKSKHGNSYVSVEHLMIVGS